MKTTQQTQHPTSKFRPPDEPRRLDDIKEPAFYDCGICGHYHAAEWDGDCREDGMRFTGQQLDDKYGEAGWYEVPMPGSEGFHTDGEIFGVANFALQQFWSAVESKMPGLGPLDTDKAGEFFTAAEEIIKSRLNNAADDNSEDDDPSTIILSCVSCPTKERIPMTAYENNPSSEMWFLVSTGTAYLGGDEQFKCGVCATSDEQERAKLLEQGDNP